MFFQDGVFLPADCRLFPACPCELVLVIRKNANSHILFRYAWAGYVLPRQDVTSPGPNGRTGCLGCPEPVLLEDASTQRGPDK